MNRIITIASILLLIVGVAQAQPIQIHASGPAVTLGNRFDTTKAMYQMRYPHLSYLPPLSTGMPYDVLVSYIYTDSLLRSRRIKEVKTWIQSQRSLNDTLKNLVKYFYASSDFNPIIFSQYSSAVTPLNNSTLQYTLLSVAEKLEELASKDEKKALKAMLYADYILRVRVIQVDSTPNMYSSINPYRYRVTANVLDTLKGRVYQAVPCTSPSRRNDAIASVDACQIIQFQYAKTNYYSEDMQVSGWGERRKNDSAFMDWEGMFHMVPGQEAIVFLKHDVPQTDSTYDYFDLDLTAIASNNALPVINGVVRDVNHYWSPNALMSYTAWKNRFIELRNKIIAKSY